MKYKEEYKQYLIIKLEMLKSRARMSIAHNAANHLNNWTDGLMIGILDVALNSFEENNDPKVLHGKLNDIYIDLNNELVKYGERLAMSYDEFVGSQRDRELKKLGV